MSQKHVRNGIMERTLSRRRLLGSTAGGFAAAMLAGGPLPGGFGREVLAQGGGKEFHAAWPYLDPGAGGHFNDFVTNAILQTPNLYGDLMYVPMGMLYWASNEWLPLVATEWSYIQTGSGGSPAASTGAVASPVSMGGKINVSADTLQVKLRQGVKWSDDTELTAKDVEATFWCLRIMSNTVWQYIDKVDALDDYTLNFHMAKPSTVVERYVVRQSVRPSSVYGEWATKAKDVFGAGKTMDDPEGKQLLQQFSQFRPKGPGPVTGPYTIDQNSITSAQFNMPKNSKSFWANQTKFDTIVNFNGETDTISAVVLSKNIDYATHGFAVATEKQMLSEGIRVLRPPVYSGPALFINYAKLTDWADERVRQAIAYAVDRARNGQISLADSGKAQKYMTGMSDNFVPTWMSQSAIDSLNLYENDQNKAGSLLEEAGWKKSGNTWKTKSGKDAAFELTFPAEFADWSASGQDLADQLSAFGIQITPRAITYTQQPIDVDKGNFELAIQGWGSSTNPHPHYSYVAAFFTHNTLAINNGGKGIDFPLTQETKVAGKVDLNQLTLNAAEGLDEEKQKANVTTIAQVFNELLPIVPLFERYGNNAALEGVRVKKWPADDDPILKNSPYADGIPTMLMLTGKLEPV